MLMLVTADNLLQLFFGWEGVGLCSYLLIGYWYDTPEPPTPPQQGVHRQPHRRLWLRCSASSLVFWTFGSLDFAAIFAGRSPQHQADTLRACSAARSPPRR